MVTKKLLVGGINTDDANPLIDTKEYIGALNVRFATTENGYVGELSNIEGNVIKNNSGSFTLPVGTNTTIGAYEDTPNKRVFFFNHNSGGSHGIYCYDSRDGLVYTVVTNAQITGGLGFSLSYPIYSTSKSGNQLFWTDNLNPQRRINVEAGIKLNHGSYSTSVAAYSSPIDQSTINLIRNPPAYPMTVAKYANGSYVNNFIKGEAFQMAYRFVYRDGEVSVFSPLSATMQINSSSDDAAGYNAINYTIPKSQFMQQDVQRIEVAVKYLTGGKMAIVKTFDKANTAATNDDLTKFVNHNNPSFSGSGFIDYFYNDIAGIAVDDASSVKQYDAVPTKSFALEIAKDRLFLGNNTSGYSAPTTTSLAVTTTSAGSPTVTGRWCRFTYLSGGATTYLWLLDITGIASGGFYAATGAPGNVASPSSFPTTYAYNLSQFRGAGVTDVLTYYGISLANFLNFTTTPNLATVTGVSSASITDIRMLKSDATYRLGVVFYDFAGRKAGVVTNEGLRVSTPDRDYAFTKIATGVSWTLSNANPTVEIPDWAYYYSVVMTKCLRTSYFMQMKADSYTYIKKDSSGAFATDATYADTHYGVGISAKTLYSYGFGYTFTEGDIMKIYNSSSATVTTVRVKGTWSDYIIVDLFNISVLATIVFEIYTPYITSFDESYYEQGAMYAVADPGLSTRSYSTVSGTISGDVIVLKRTISSVDYYMEAMSPSDKYYSRWYTNAGRPSIVVAGSAVNNKVQVCFSEIVVLGTLTNGLSSFDALNYTTVPIELNSIQMLKLVSKVEAEGTVMLAIGEQETVAMYLGEAQLFDNTGSSFLSKATGVVGNMNVLRGSFGTLNPESVVRFMGQVFWFDANRGMVVSYSNNGLFPISSNKMSRYFRKVGQDVLASNLKFFGGVDPYHGEILMFAPRKTVIPQNTNITDVVISSAAYSYAGSGDVSVTITPGRVYQIGLSAGVTATYKGEQITGLFVAYEDSSTITVTAGAAGSFTLTQVLRGVYEPYDGQGGVWSYQPNIQKWVSRYSFRPEWMSQVGNRLVTFKSGYPYVHNSATFNTFYGQAYDSAVAFVHNEAGDVTKVYQNISLEGDTPDKVHIRTEVPNVQSSEISGGAIDYSTMMEGEFVNHEGVKYAPILRDRLSPNVSGSADVKSLIGDPMRGDYGKFQVVFSQPTSRKLLKFANIGYVPSRGHTNLPNG